MDSAELQDVVNAIIGQRRLDGVRPHELVAGLRRRRLPGDHFEIVAPLLESQDKVTVKAAIDIIGKLKNPPVDAAAAVESAWERSWEFDVPQACTEAFRALLRIGGQEERLLAMIERVMQVDNYGIHKDCAQTLMKISGGECMLADWGNTIAGQCDCHLHEKLAARIRTHLAAS